MKKHILLTITAVICAVNILNSCKKDEIPEVTTSEITYISGTSATIVAKLISEGSGPITTFGVCWSTNQNPVFNEHQTIANQGTTDFTALVEELSPNTTYFARAFAINSAGIGYGNTVTFTTLKNNGPIVFNTLLEYGSLTDADGNSYKTILIGTQTWMAENLKTTIFNDGSPIPEVTSNTEWSSLVTPAYCWYNNNKSDFFEAYGALYNGYAINTGKLCPTGWHVPEDDELVTFTLYQGFNEDGPYAGRIKEAGTAHWRSPNKGATNESGLTAMPGGARGENGHFDNLGNHGYYWKSGSGNAFEIFFWSDVFLPNVGPPINSGMSVRCIKD